MVLEIDRDEFVTRRLQYDLGHFRTQVQERMAIQHWEGIFNLIIDDDIVLLDRARWEQVKIILKNMVDIKNSPCEFPSDKIVVFDALDGWIEELQRLMGDTDTDDEDIEGKRAGYSRQAEADDTKKSMMCPRCLYVSSDFRENKNSYTCPACKTRIRKDSPRLMTRLIGERK